MIEKRLSRYRGFTLADDEKLRSDVLDILHSEHKIIIETIFDKLPGSNLIRATFIGIFLFIIHFLISEITGEPVLYDWSFLICLIISLTLGFGYLGIRYMRDFVSKMAPLTGQTLGEFRETYLRQLYHFSSGGHLTTWGVIFGFLTVSAAFVSGLWYESLALKLYLLTLQFTAGFLNGCIIGGMWGIIRIIYQLGDQSNVRFKYFDPDSCGGTLLVGSIITRIGLIFLIGGSFIAFYVWISPWTNGDAFWVGVLINSFAIFPFFVTLCVFAIPVIGLHRALSTYKAHTKEEIRDSMLHLSSEILSTTDNSDGVVGSREVQRNQYEQLERMYFMPDNMNTWPYNLNHRIAIVASALLGPATGQALNYTIDILQNTNS